VPEEGQQQNDRQWNANQPQERAFAETHMILRASVYLRHQPSTRRCSSVSKELNLSPFAGSLAAASCRACVAKAAISASAKLSFV
jgi:hypothetical protein